MKTWTTREKIYGAIGFLFLAYFVGWPIVLEQFPCFEPESFRCRVQTTTEKIKQHLEKTKN